jgi:hypothetical protein
VRVRTLSLGAQREANAGVIVSPHGPVIWGLMSDCIPWPDDHIGPTGYGWVSYKGRVVGAHRMVMGFPDGQVGHVCHDEAAHRGECTGGSGCLHRRCVNPDHLRVMTAQENSEASPYCRVARKFDTHCAQGHEFTAENTVWESKGKGYRGRKCKECKNQRQRSRYVPKPRRTHCTKGHEYTSENTRVKPRGERVCRICAREWARESRANWSDDQKKRMREYRQKRREDGKE